MNASVKTIDQSLPRFDARTPGAVFRSFRDEQDFPAMAAVINAANQADGVDELITVEALKNSYAHLERSDTATDTIFAEAQGQLVGYGRCKWSEQLSGDYVYLFHIDLHPDWRASAIPLVMIEYLQARLKAIATNHPPGPAKHYQTKSVQGAAWHEELMQRFGYAPMKYEVSMVRPCSQPVTVTPLPPGIQVRPVRPADYRQIWDAQVEAFQEQAGFVPATENDYQRYISQAIVNPEIWQVAWEGDQVVGMVLNIVDPAENEAFNRKRGYTEDIAVRRPWRRQGIARALLTRSIHMFQQMGMDETELGVNTHNPSGAFNLYHSVGYRQRYCVVTYRSPLGLDQ